MANQITHIVFADRAYEKHFSHFDKKDFFIGTVFPDIRYLSGTSRRVTHIDEPTIQSTIAQPTAFLGGLHFHSLVDHVRQQFMVKTGLFEHYPKDDSTNRPLKCYEDELLYSKVGNWEEVIDYFDNILPEELSYTIGNEHVRQWHNILQKYFARQPDNESNIGFFKSLGFGDEMIASFRKVYNQLENDAKAKQVIEQMWDQMDDLILQTVTMKF